MLSSSLRLFDSLYLRSLSGSPVALHHSRLVSKCVLILFLFLYKTPFASNNVIMSYHFLCFTLMKHLTFTRDTVGRKRVSRWAGTTVAAITVVTTLLTVSVVEGTFVDIWKKKNLILRTVQAYKPHFYTIALNLEMKAFGTRTPTCACFSVCIQWIPWIARAFKTTVCVNAALCTSWGPFSTLVNI